MDEKGTEGEGAEGSRETPGTPSDGRVIFLDGED